MGEKGTLLLGIDLCEDFTQISIYNRQTKQPDSVSFGAEAGKLRIPTALVLRRNTGEWLIGEEAVSFSEQNRTDRDICLITDMLEMAEQGGMRNVFGAAYSAASLLEKFFKKLLSQILSKYEGDSFLGITICLREHRQRLEEVIVKAMGAAGIDKLQLRIVSRLEVFMYYAVNQQADIWVNDVALFDYDAEGLVFYRLTFGRKLRPIVISASKKDLSDRMSKKDLDTLRPELLAKIFNDVSDEILYRQIISSVFVTGPGFEGDWSMEVLKKLCNGRRVFRGQNLYTKGACYYSLMFFEQNNTDFITITDTMIQNDISLRAFHDGDFTEIPLVSAGSFWKEAERELYVIMDNTDEIDLLVRNVCKRDPLCAIIALNAIGNTSGKDMRLRVNLSFLDRDTAVITIRDDGFGELRKSSGRIWEQILKL